MKWPIAQSPSRSLLSANKLVCLPARQPPDDPLPRSAGGTSCPVAFHRRRLAERDAVRCNIGGNTESNSVDSNSVSNKSGALTLAALHFFTKRLGSTQIFFTFFLESFQPERFRRNRVKIGMDASWVLAAGAAWTDSARRARIEWLTP